VCAGICVERGLGSTVAVTPIAVEAWTPSWWNDRVMSSRTTALMPTFIVHGRVRPIIGNGGRGGGPRDSQLRLRALRVPQARRKYAGGGVGRSRAYVVVSGEAEIVPDKAQGSGEAETVP
jgi:hypothetical protein